MRINRTVFLLIIALTVGGTFLWSQDDSFDDGSFFQEITDGSGSASSGDAAAPASNLDISGTAELTSRYTLDYDIPGDSPVSPVPSLDLTLDYTGKNADVHATVSAEQDPGEDTPEGSIDELYIRYYASGFDMEAGYMKVVWGPGDKIHSIDVLNSTDYSDFINPDYIDRRRAEPMIKMNFSVNDGLLEAVYLPVFAPDTIITGNEWQTAQATAIDAAVTGGASVEDTADLEHSGFAVRYSKTIGPADLGAVYYMGNYRQPTVNPTDYSITYDRVQMVGVDGAGVVGGFNLRSEAGWYMTDDLKGDDPDIRNSEFRWVGGFDVELPVTGWNFNIQETGTLILQYDKIGDTGDAQSNYDQTSNMLIIRLSDSWNGDTVSPELTGIWGLEYGDWLIKPSLDIDVDDDFTISGSAGIYGGDSGGLLGQFDNNDYIEIALEYNF